MEVHVRVVAALGGNALLQRGGQARRRRSTRPCARGRERPVTDGHEHELLICHGNGPQVGVLALKSASDDTLTRPYPLDDLVAQTQGMIGYWLTQSLRNAGVTKPVLSLITQTRVDSSDPAFAAPSKFIGPGNSHEQARKLAHQHELEGRGRREPVAVGGRLAPGRCGSSSKLPSPVCWTRGRW